MRRLDRKAAGFVASLSATLLAGGCPHPPSDSVLVHTTIAVPGAGAHAALSFRGTAGQTIRVTLIGMRTCLSPYATLRNPDGTSSGSVPGLDTALCGSNTGETTLPWTGTYSLSVFSGANAGGRISVTIETMSD